MTFRTLVWPAGLLVLSAVSAFGQSEQWVAGSSPWTTGTTIYQPFAQQAGVTSHLKGFSVVLVEGDLRGTAPSEGVPAAVAKALADLKDFLPYKSYRLIDSQWTLGSGRVAMRLRGAAGQDYELTIVAQERPAAFYFAPGARTGGMTADRLAERSTAGESAKPAVTISTFELREPDALERAAELALKGLAPSHPDVRAAQATHARSSSLIDTSFRMDIGETVVVGTSRLQGDKALLVLLTAVGR